ncbi:MAG: N-acetyltransferase [Deltaproteobacteria bacterium]|nr:MAG: N-acetyltransferase [Deltaproteobacteria bacterium]
MSNQLKSEFKITDKITSRVLTTADAPELFALVDSNRDFLGEWLPWLDYNTEVKHSEDFIKVTLESFNESKSLIHGIFYEDEMVGNGGFHTLTWSQNKTSIGYWLAEGHNGKGIITSYCKTIIDYAFSELDMNRIEILACIDNQPSCAVAERLGFKLEGIKRQNQKLHGKFFDHNQYSILKSEWN